MRTIRFQKTAQVQVTHVDMACNGTQRLAAGVHGLQKYVQSWPWLLLLSMRFECSCIDDLILLAAY